MIRAYTALFTATLGFFAWLMVLESIGFQFDQLH